MAHGWFLPAWHVCQSCKRQQFSSQKYWWGVSLIWPPQFQQKNGQMKWVTHSDSETVFEDTPQAVKGILTSVGRGIHLHFNTLPPREERRRHVASCSVKQKEFLVCFFSWWWGLILQQSQKESCCMHTKAALKSHCDCLHSALSMPDIYFTPLFKIWQAVVRHDSGESNVCVQCAAPIRVRTTARVDLSQTPGRRCVTAEEATAGRTAPWVSCTHRWLYVFICGCSAAWVSEIDR